MNTDRRILKSLCDDCLRRFHVFYPFIDRAILWEMVNNHTSKPSSPIRIAIVLLVAALGSFRPDCVKPSRKYYLAAWKQLRGWFRSLQDVQALLLAGISAGLLARTEESFMWITYAGSTIDFIVNSYVTTYHSQPVGR